MKRASLGAGCAAALLTAFTASAGFAADLPVDLELVIAVDVSGSMDADEFALQRGGYVAAIRHPDFIAAIREGAFGRIALSYVEWSGSERQRIVVPWTLIDGADSAGHFSSALAGQPIAGDGGTSISSAILFGTRLFDDNGYDGDRRVIDISGDGPNNYGPVVTTARDVAVAQGVVINGLPVLIRPSPLFPAMDAYYADCVIGGDGAFMLPVDAADQFALAIRRKLVLEVAARPMRATSPRSLPVSGRPPVDCLIGERLRSKYADPFLPGL